MLTKSTDGSDQVHDLLDFESLLDSDERALLREVREGLGQLDDVELRESWEQAEFPMSVVDHLAQLGLLGQHLGERPARSHLLRGMLTAELARKDASLATFVGVTGALFGLSVKAFGSQRQRDDVLPAVASGKIVGCFALTEPGHGSDVAGGITTMARRDGDDWILHGEKRWIGNATWCHRAVVWAKEQGGDGRVLGFLVPTDAPGWSVRKIEGKYSLRAVQNGHIVLDDVRVPETDRLPGVESFKQLSEVLKQTRLEVGWVALGNSIGAFDAARAHALQHQQFGRPIAKFQLVQDLLVRTELNISSSVGILAQASRLADEGRLREEQASMAKLHSAARARESAAHCREILGGDGITLEAGAIKHFMDAEAISTFEGTHQINTLLVGRALTGVSAFV